MADHYFEDLFSLKGKTAILTGATGGLGSSIALALASAGASIVSIELPDDPSSSAVAQKIKDSGGDSTCFKCDLRNPSDLRQCFTSIWEAGIVPAILVNCAGIVVRGPAVEITDSDIDLVSGAAC